MARPPIPECAPKRSIPKSGELRVRPRYVECDPMGVVHHSSYLPWMEMARTEMLRGCGVSYADLEAMGVFLVITRLDVRYLRPAHYDQELLLRCEVVGGGRARLNHEYELLEVREDGSIGTVLLTASTTLACVDGDGKPTPLPEWLTPTSHD